VSPSGDGNDQRINRSRALWGALALGALVSGCALTNPPPAHHAPTRAVQPPPPAAKPPAEPTPTHNATPTAPAVTAPPPAAAEAHTATVESTTESPSNPFQPLPTSVVLTPALRALLLQTQSYEAAKDFDAADACLTRAVRIGAQNPWVWIKKAELRLAQADRPQAAAYARKAKVLALHDHEAAQRATALIAEAVKSTP